MGNTLTTTTEAEPPPVEQDPVVHDDVSRGDQDNDDSREDDLDHMPADADGDADASPAEDEPGPHDTAWDAALAWSDSLSPHAADAGLRATDTTITERENRYRLEQILLVCERQMQHVTQKVWDARASSRAALPKSLPPFQRPLLADPIDKWDVSMCNAVLKQLGGLKKKSEAAAVGAIVDARNLCAHAAGGRVVTEKFEQHADACMKAFTALGGDATTLQKLRVSENDARDSSILACSREATKAAESEKLAGNRFFREDNFEDARACYTRGLQIPGAVDPEVRSQLHNNRATANILLKEFPQAKEDAKHAAELAPQWAKPHLRLAEIYYETYKYQKAVARLEIALGHATAARDTAVVKEVTAKLADYRLERDKSARREGENLALGPMFEMQKGGATRAAAQARLGMNETQDPMAMMHQMAKLQGTGMEAKQHILLAQMARSEGRLNDAAREFLAAAVAGDAEGMYNYAVYQMNGRGTRKDLAGAVRWLEKAALMPVTDSPAGKFENVGIGEAMSVLGELYDSGVHFAQDKLQARIYWERSAELNVRGGLNNFGLCLMNGSHGVKQDLPRARELFRRSAEFLFNPAMSNLGVLHGMLFEFETAARWADAAFKFGFLPAANAAESYRNLAIKGASLPQPARDALSATVTDTYEQPELARRNETPTLDLLRAIGSPYGDRLLAAKLLIGDAMQALLSSPTDEFAVDQAVNLAVQAHRIDDNELVFSQEEIGFSAFLATTLQEAGAPINEDLALLSKPSDASSAIAFWKSLHRRFPNDLAITKRAACMHMFTAYAGADIRRGVELFQHAFSLLPRPNDDSDPHTLDLLYLAGVAYFQSQDLKRAGGLLTRFLKYASADGHRKGPEAHYILGAIAMTKISSKKQGSKMDTSQLAYRLREGDRLLQKVPSFLRAGAQDSPNRKILERILRTVGAIVDPPQEVGSCCPSQRRGGELVDGPRRHPKLRCDSPTFQPKWRGEIASMAAASNKLLHGMKWSTNPARQSTGSKSSEKLTVATIDELFSALEDRVYTSRKLKCIVVSLPSFNGSSFQFVVEDSQREPAKMAVYNAPPSLISQLVPGSAFELWNPYVRLAQDGSIMLRVDNPCETIHVETLYEICWVCSVESAPREQLKRCAKCHKAVYCSKKCQVHDWSVDGHRFLCKTIRAMK